MVRRHEGEGRVVVAREHGREQRLAGRSGVGQARGGGAVHEDGEPAQAIVAGGRARRGDGDLRRLAPQPRPRQLHRPFRRRRQLRRQPGRRRQLHLDPRPVLQPVEPLALLLHRAGVAEDVGVGVVERDLGHAVAVEVGDRCRVRARAHVRQRRLQPLAVETQQVERARVRPRRAVHGDERGRRRAVPDQLDGRARGPAVERHLPQWRRPAPVLPQAVDGGEMEEVDRLPGGVLAEGRGAVRGHRPEAVAPQRQREQLQHPGALPEFGGHGRERPVHEVGADLRPRRGRGRLGGNRRGRGGRGIGHATGERERHHGHQRYGERGPHRRQR